MIANGLIVIRVDWDNEEPTYEVRTPGSGTSDDWTTGECLGVFETRDAAEAFAKGCEAV